MQLIIITLGVVVSAAGYWSLFYVDPQGSNWAATIALIGILGGLSIFSTLLWRK